MLNPDVKSNIGVDCGGSTGPLVARAIVFSFVNLKEFKKLRSLILKYSASIRRVTIFDL